MSNIANMKLTVESLAYAQFFAPEIVSYLVPNVIILLDWL
jgi:hypothetical protein